MCVSGTEPVMSGSFLGQVKPCPILKYLFAGGKEQRLLIKSTCVHVYKRVTSHAASLALMALYRLVRSFARSLASVRI